MKTKIKKMVLLFELLIWVNLSVKVADSTQIAFELFNDDFNAEIYVMNDDGSHKENLTEHPAKDKYPAWSPDGTKMAFSSNRDDRFQIYVMDKNEKNVTQLTDLAGDNNFPRWSPNGKHIAFVSKVDFIRNIYVMNSDGTNRIQLTNGKIFDSSPAWSPDGTKMAFHSQRKNNWDSYFNRYV